MVPSTMKRDPHLARISWEHHAALIVSARILNGLERGVDPAVVAAYALHTWEHWLLGHNRLEEELLEARAALVPVDPRMSRRLREEHDAMERLAAKLWDRGERLTIHLSEFAGTLRNHVRFEEQELLPALERARPDGEPEAPNDDYRPPEIDWHEPFWE